MILIGEQQETDYRLMRRSMAECLAAAPVAGIQSYLLSFSRLVDAKGPESINPYGCTRKYLRNTRLLNTINATRIQTNGRCEVFNIHRDAREGFNIHSRITYLYHVLWVICTWIFYGAIVALVYKSKGMTWIGISNCMTMTAFSILIRIAENRCLEVKATAHYNLNASDAAILLGPTNSCLVLEGNHERLKRWIVFGLQVKQALYAKILEAFVRLSAIFLLLFVFITIPNGSTWDQVTFICINLLGQLNNIVGRSLNVLDCSSALEKKVDVASPTLTHVYAFLLRRFGAGAWVDEVDLLPGTGIWRRWRHGIVLDRNVDAKVLYGSCQARYANEKYHEGKATQVPQEKVSV